MKIIARWTVGPCSECGVEILRESVNLFANLYPEAERMVCYNQIDRPVNINASLYEQHQDELGYPLTSTQDDIKERSGSGWKLCPPRMDINCHELWIDNDIVIHQKMKEIDQWIKGDYCIISEGLGRYFGIYNNLVPSGLKICAGFFGLPPDFDFRKEILKHCELLNGKTIGSWDEQGLVASIITNKKHKVVPLTSLAIVEPDFDLPDAPAFHFVEANRIDSHKKWEEFKFRKILHL